MHSSNYNSYFIKQKIAILSTILIAVLFIAVILITYFSSLPNAEKCKLSQNPYTKYSNTEANFAKCASVACGNPLKMNGNLTINV